MCHLQLYAAATTWSIDFIHGGIKQNHMVRYTNYKADTWSWSRQYILPGRTEFPRKMCPPGHISWWTDFPPTLYLTSTYKNIQCQCPCVFIVTGGGMPIDVVLWAATAVKAKVNSQAEIFFMVNSQATKFFWCINLHSQASSKI